MNVTKRKCDCCGKEAEDYYEAIGWIQFQNNFESFSIIISKGRKPDKTAKTAFYQSRQLDFCKLSCFTEWMKRLEKHKVS